MKREILCSEAWARFDPATVAKVGRGSYAVDAEVANAQFGMQLCKPFPLGIVPVDDAAPMRTTAPILWLAGDGDPQDPPANLVNVSAQNPNATIVVVPVQNHTVSHLGCLPDVVESFLASATGAVDTGCVSSIPALPAFRVR
jgi:pimeloyl-ACP methyl ester carboxylesterase